MDRRHRGQHYGEDLVAFALTHAIWLSQFQAVRYVIVDSLADRVGWYKDLGFQVHKTEQRKRRKDAKGRKQDPDGIAVRMLYDLNDLALELFPSSLLIQLGARLRWSRSLFFWVHST